MAHQHQATDNKTRHSRREAAGRRQQAGSATYSPGSRTRSMTLPARFGAVGIFDLEVDFARATSSGSRLVVEL